jgi:tetratricopeptide (TPR) repeat protein
VIRANITVRVAIALVAFLPISAHATEATKTELQTLLDAGHYKRAKALVETRLHANPKDAEALYGAGVIREADKDIDGAITAVEQAIAIEPNKAAYHSQLGEMYGTKAQSVSMFSAMKFAHKIRDEGNKALQLDPKSSDAYELLIQYYLQAPGVAGGDKNKAYAMLDELFKFDGVRANLIRGELALKDKQGDKTENYYQNAVRADANSYMAQTALANFYIGRKNYAAGETGARDMLRIDRGRITAYLFLVAICVAQEKWQQLDATLADSEKNVPDDFDAYYQAGRILYTEGKDLPRAERYFKKYLSQDPEIGAPALAHAHWRLGLVYEKEGRKPEAIQELQTAVTMKPDLDDAKKDLKRLK